MANDLTVEFGLSGNGADYRGTGWSEPENTGTWMLGQQSLLVLPRPETRGDYRMEFDIGALTGPGHPTQRLSVVVNGTVVAEFALVDDGVERCTLPWSVIGREPGLTLVLSHPDAWRPADLNDGEGDQREMSFFLRSARLSLHHALPVPAPVAPAKPAAPAAATPAAATPAAATPSAAKPPVPAAPAAATPPAATPPAATPPIPAAAATKTPVPTPAAAAPVAAKPPAPVLPASRPAPKPAVLPLAIPTPPAAVPLATPASEARVPWWKKLLG